VKWKYKKSSYFILVCCVVNSIALSWTIIEIIIKNIK
jgi:hypothetical protein